MIEIAIGGLTFSLLGCSTLLAVMLSERKQYRFTIPECEPGYRVAGKAVVSMTKPITFRGKPIRRVRHRGTNSPGKHMTLKQLTQIKADNYCGVGAEYVAEEIDAAVLAVSQSRADKMVCAAVKKLTMQDIDF